MSLVFLIYSLKICSFLSGDVVFNSANQATITILANDDAYGVFHFIAPFSQTTEEGSAVTYG